MKYNFKLTPTGKAVAEWALTNYKAEKAMYEREKQELIRIPISKYEMIPMNGNPQRTTENLAIDIITVPYLQRMEMSITAVERTLQECDDIDRKLVDHVYFRKDKNVEGAGLEAHLSRAATYKRINAILACVAFMLGYVRIEK